jgi:hypothetical protein
VIVKTKEQQKQWMNTRSPYKLKKFKQTLSACQKSDGNCFPGQKRSADSGTHKTMDHNNIRSVLQNIKKTVWGHSEKKRHSMLTSGLVLLHDNARLHTAAYTRALLEHFNWELYEHPSYNPDLTPSNCHPFTYLKDW